MKIPIFFKLFSVIALLLIAVSLFTSSKIADYFEKTTLKREEEISLNLSRNLSQQADRYFKSVVDRARFYSSFLMSSSTDQWSKEIENILANESEIIGLEIYTRDNTDKAFRSVKRSDFFKKYQINSLLLDQASEQMKAYNHYLLDGKLKLQAISLNQQLPLIWLGLPLLRGDNNEVNVFASVFINQERIQELFRDNGHYKIALLDEFGTLMAHPDEKKVFSNESWQKEEAFQDAANTDLMIKQFMTEMDHQRFLTSYSKTSFGPIVVSKIPESIYQSPIVFVKKQAIYILVFALAISVSLISLLSNTLTKPIEKLNAFTKRISTGEFDLNIRSQVTSHDEVGELAQAMDQMSSGLKEREKMKNIFDKFHGASIAQELLTQEIGLAGSKKEVVVFFSDIRSFTKYSESHSAEEVVFMLNEYMDAMVKVIYKNNGIVDKFVGDAIMAVWGVPTKSDNDVEMAITACLEMRESLNELNQKRIKRGDDPIMIGMGLHVGEVISGTVGSEDRMEYTIIGDTVNTAARIEASTKSFGTDLLISGQMQKLCENSFITLSAGQVSAKGKSEALGLYKVEGIKTAQGDRLIRTPYSHFTPEDDGEKIKVVA